MKTEIDHLMKLYDLDAILVTGNGHHNPAMVYLTGGAHMTPEFVKKRDSTPLLFCHPMERDEAAGTGIEVRSLANYPLKEFLRKCDGDHTKAMALRTKKILEDSNVQRGRIAIYGRGEVGSAYSILTALQDLMPELTLVGETGDTLLQKAMFTKDQDEIKRIQRTGKICGEILDDILDFLASHRLENEVLVKSDSNPLTIGEVKNRIDLQLVERGLENPQGMIFSTGRDTGIPHSAGKTDDLLRAGVPIVFDLYPCEKGGGYFHDMTRTWCLGYAPDEFLALFEDVKNVYDRIRNSLASGVHCYSYQESACDLFESQGHPTIRSNPKTEQGYVHTLGHGVGLNIHERPWFNETASEEDRLIPGVVFTIEPGLYYPERGLGVRLEDTFWVNPEGVIDSFVEYPFRPVLALKK